MNDAPLEVRKPRKRLSTLELTTAVAECVANGKTQGEVAAKYGVSPGVISRAVRKAVGTYKAPPKPPSDPQQRGSALQWRVERRLREVCTGIVAEHEDPSRTTIQLSAGHVHIVDFYIPQYALFVEVSGVNHTGKLLKMRRAHLLTGINYYALIDVSHPEYGMPSMAVQLEELVELLKAPPEVGWSVYSRNRLDDLVTRFSEAYWGS